MKLNTIPKDGQWSNISDRLNDNFSKVDVAVEALQDATIKNCGYFSTANALREAYPTASAGAKAYVGLTYPFAIYLWDATTSTWMDSGETGGEESVNLSDYYTKEEIDAKEAELYLAVKNAEKKEIASINRVNTTSSISYIYDMEEYNIGDCFMIEIKQMDNVVPDCIIMDGEGMAIGGVDLYENRYVFCKNTESLKQLRIKAVSIDSQVPRTFVATFYKVVNIPIGYLNDTSYTRVNQNIDIRPNINGYYDSEELTLSYEWVTTHIFKSRGFTFMLDANFDTYVLEVTRFYNDFRTRLKQLVTAKTRIDLTQCYGWVVKFRRIDRNHITPSDDLLADVNIEVSSIAGAVFEKPVVKSEVEDAINDKAVELNTQIITKIAYINPLGLSPYYAHYAANGFIRDGQGRNVIASESLEDVAMMARLGYSMIEANIHKNASGDYIVIHGDTKNNPITFGDEVIDISNGMTGSGIVISDTTTEYMKKYIRYNSDILKYQTSVPTLEEFCQCCKENNIGIFAGTADRDAIEICRKYVGDNFILYGADVSIRKVYAGWVYTWNNSATSTIDSLIDGAEKYGRPYICGIGPNILDKFTENNELDSFIAKMHERGYLVGVAATYQSESEVRDFFRRGGDVAAAGHEVNPFEPNYECVDIDGDPSQFITTGTIEGGVVTLINGETLKYASEGVIPLGKGSLTTRFEGTLRITFGSKGARTITSDGQEYIVITDYYLGQNTDLTVTAKADTVITALCYKTSKC